MKHVCILNGIHRGAIVEIGDRPILIGGDADCDALLCDVSARDSAVRISSRSDGTLVAMHERGNVSKDRRRLRPDRQKPLREGSVLGIGDVEVAVGQSLSAAVRARANRDRQRTMMNWGGACLACLAIFGVIGAVGGPADAYNSLRTVTATAHPAEAAHLRRDPLTELERAVARNDLSGSVVVKRNESGQIVATGAVDSNQRMRWNKLVRWFDGRFGDEVMLDSRLVERNDDIVLPFQIVSVHAAPNPRIVIQNGQTFPVGSILPGGWELRRIARMQIVLARGDRELAISF